MGLELMSMLLPLVDCILLGVPGNPVHSRGAAATRWSAVAHRGAGYLAADLSDRDVSMGICQSNGLSLKWSVTHMVIHSYGLSLIWSFTQIVINTYFFHSYGLSHIWSVNHRVCHAYCLKFILSAFILSVNHMVCQ